MGGHGQANHGAGGDTIWEQVFRGGGHADAEAGGRRGCFPGGAPGGW